MRLSLPIVLLLGASHAHAGRLTVEKAEAYFKREKPCVLAIAPVYPKREGSVLRLNQQLTGAAVGDVVVQSGKPDGDVDVICVFTGTKYKGTINEIKGCFAGYFNPAKDIWEGLLKAEAERTIVVEGTDCTKEATKLLLTSAKIVSDLKESRTGQNLKVRLGNYNTVFELILRAAGLNGNPDLKILYDQFELASALCPKSPCGPVINLEDQLAAIRPEAKPTAAKPVVNPYFEMAERNIAKRKAADVQREKEEAERKKVEREKKEALWK